MEENFKLATDKEIWDFFKNLKPNRPGAHVLVGPKVFDAIQKHLGKDPKDKDDEKTQENG